MRVLFLPGMFSTTEAWAAKVLAASGGADWQSRVQRYSHWGGGNEENMDVTAELERLRGEKADLLFGKSMGALLVLMATGQKLLNPERVVLLGVPTNICRERGIDLAALAREIAVPTLCIQQTNDKTGPCAELRRLVTENPSFTIHEIAGEDHQYKDIPQLARIIKKWLSA